MLKDFKEFAMRGNVVDLAVAVVIGAAFGKIVASQVQASPGRFAQGLHRVRTHVELFQ